MPKPLLGLVPLALLAACTTVPEPGGGMTVETLSGPERQARDYLARIEAVDRSGPRINSVIAVNSRAPVEARAAQATGLMLDGRSVLVKDNIETRELPTTAGSLALVANETGRDAPLIANLRRNGGVVLGKTNLSEWANIRGANSTSGWSAVGGQTHNPHALDRSPCGSSSGSGAAVAAGLAWAAIGTETDGSVTCPASVNGIVGFKPSVGQVSRTHVVPISSSQDTAGPMARSVMDAAMLLDAIAGRDPDDPATYEAPARRTPFAAGLAGASLDGVRIGVLRNQVGTVPGVTQLFEQALADMAAAGAVLVDIDYTPQDAMYEAEFTVLLYELRETMDAYLAGSPATIPVRSLADVVAFNRANAGTELRWFGQEHFEQALQTTDRAAYEQARATSLRLAGAEGIDRLLSEYDVAVLVAPTTGFAWPIDLVYGDDYPGSVGAGSLAAIAGYPHLTVPMGAWEGLPAGISFMGAKWQDGDVLRLGAAYESARSKVVPEPSFSDFPLPE